MILETGRTQLKDHSMMIELKKPGVPARAAFDDNLTYYKQQIPNLFWFNALMITDLVDDARISFDFIRNEKVGCSIHLS